MPEKVKRVGYVLRRFPVLSETFVLNEILEVEAQGVQVEVYSLLQPRDSRYHEGLSKLKASIRYIPNIFDLKSLFKYNVRAYKSFGWRYFRVLLGCIATGHPKLVWRFFQAAYVAERARERRIEHLHAHFANRAASVARIAHKLSGIPYSFTAHAVDIYKQGVRKNVLARKIDEARFVVTVSDCNKEYLADIANGSSNKITRIYNGIDLDRFRPNGTIRNEPIKILSVARFVEKKGLNILIETCSILQKEGLDFRCQIVGKGRQRPALAHMIKEYGLKDRVRLLGPHTQIEILDRYREADLFVLPCLVASDGNRDGLPVSIVEALACGIPVVTTPVTGNSEVVHDGVNGLMVPTGDPESLARAIQSLVEDRDAYDRLQANARDSVVDNFNIHNSAKSLTHMFTEGHS